MDPVPRGVPRRPSVELSGEFGRTQLVQLMGDHTLRGAAREQISPAIQFQGAAGFGQFQQVLGLVP